jgi:hypothetical protein
MLTFKGIEGRRSREQVTSGWWLVAGGWWLVAGGWWLVAGGWWLVEKKIEQKLFV